MNNNNEVIKKDLKNDEKPFYSKYHVENFEEDLKNTKFSFIIPEEFDENNLYLELVEE